MPLYGLAAEAAVARGMNDRALLHVEACGTRAVRERMAALGLLPPPTEADLAVGRTALSKAGADAVTLFLGPHDLLVWHHGSESCFVRVAGVGERVRRLALQVETALGECGPLEPILDALGEVMEPGLSRLGRSVSPLVVLPHGHLRAVPWDLLPIQGKALGEWRACAEGLSLSLLGHVSSRRGGGAVVIGPDIRPRHIECTRLLGVGVALPATKADFFSALDQSWSMVIAHGGPTTLKLGDCTLESTEILGHTLGAGLVLLGSCSTARIQVAPDPLDVVAPALLASGARVVIAPTVPVDAAESIKFLAALAVRITKGEPLLSAFAAVRAESARDASQSVTLAAFRVLTRDLSIFTTSPE